MDTALLNGDFLLSNRNKLLSIFGMDEILQRIFIRLSVPKGSFAYHRSFGSELYKLKNHSDHLPQRAKALAEQALDGLDGVAIDDVEISYDEAQNMILTVHVSIKDRKKDVVIKI